ncbi:MAG TPA: hydroxymethylbilane synthase [Thermogutta sp.]|nr:hydroxymethylbilane synthase [Thermogutta sp.]HQF14481.1 hydroxymethylbilane synthase [Thermogutta sp.]
MTSGKTLRLGTRGSLLARWQAEWVASQLRAHGVEVEIVPVLTSGDRNQHWAVESLGGAGVFTKEIQLALLANEVDLAVHSMKDLPTQPVPGLAIAAIPKRGPVGDVLISRTAQTFEQLPSEAIIGTGSRRRAAQILHYRKDLTISPLRGNLDTRLRKLDSGLYDAIVLAQAGLERLNITGRMCEPLTPRFLLPAVGQGALAVECRLDDEETRQCLTVLNDPISAAEVTAERSFLRHLEAGCLAPVAAWCRAVGSSLLLTGRVLSVDGTTKLEVSCLGDIENPEELGRRVAQLLIAQGAKDLIRQAKTIPMAPPPDAKPDIDD